MLERGLERGAARLTGCRRTSWVNAYCVKIHAVSLSVWSILGLVLGISPLKHPTLWVTELSSELGCLGPDPDHLPLHGK